jgi:hypothetical protein
MRRVRFESAGTRMDIRIGLFVGLAILGSQGAVDAQTRPGAGAAHRADSPAIRGAASAPSASASVGTRPPGVSPSFNRVVTTGRSSPSAEPRGPYGAGGPLAAGAMREDDPFRPYSARVREAQLQAAMGTTRPRPYAVARPQPVQPSHNYYPGLRVGRHCTPSRAGVLAGGAGRSR